MFNRFWVINKSVFLWWSWLHNLGWTTEPAPLSTALRRWVRRFTMIISAWWFRTSSKFSGQDFQETGGNIRSLETPKQDSADSSNHKVVIVIKSARIVLYLASDAVRWQEDEYAQQQQWNLMCCDTVNRKIKTKASLSSEVLIKYICYCWIYWCFTSLIK